MAKKLEVCHWANVQVGRPLAILGSGRDFHAITGSAGPLRVATHELKLHLKSTLRHLARQLIIIFDHNVLQSSYVARTVVSATIGVHAASNRSA